MRIFCPYCSAEHAIDVNQIPLVGMGFHCPQCRRSFHVTADGDVEATDEGGGGGPQVGVRQREGATRSPPSPTTCCSTTTSISPVRPTKS